MLIIGVMLFKHFGLLKEEFGRMCSTLITRVTLPALIFITLIHAEFDWDYTKMTLLLMSASVVGLGLGWLIARAFRVDGPGTAPVILTTGFSSSSVLGVPLISELYPGDKQQVVDAIVSSVLGMAPLVITAGTMIALYYGAHSLNPKERRKAVLS